MLHISYYIFCYLFRFSFLIKKLFFLFLKKVYFFIYLFKICLKFESQASKQNNLNFWNLKCEISQLIILRFQFLLHQSECRGKWKSINFLRKSFFGNRNSRRRCFATLRNRGTHSKWMRKSENWNYQNKSKIQVDETKFETRKRKCIFKINSLFKALYDRWATFCKVFQESSKRKTEIHNPLELTGSFEGDVIFKISKVYIGKSESIVCTTQAVLIDEILEETFFEELENVEDDYEWFAIFRCFDFVFPFLFLWEIKIIA